MKRIGDWSPWGWIDSVDHYGEGICFVSTASHGGFYVAPWLANLMAPTVLECAFNDQGRNGWFEEDCDAALVIASFPDRFEPEVVAQAKESIKYHHKSVAALFE